MNPLTATLKAFASALEQLSVPFVIGGSMASSARGVPRMTLDVDIVAAISVGLVDRVVQELGRDWYADADQMRHAILQGRAFNIIHMRTGVKVDVFPATSDFHQSQLRRAKRMVLAFVHDSAEYPVATAEDILLAKLRWYKDGGESSERQWRDITGILATNLSLDRNYLDDWAARLDVQALLARALKETS